MEGGILTHPHRVHLYQDRAHPLSCKNCRKAGSMYSKPVTRERPQGHSEEQLALRALQTSSFFFQLSRSVSKNAMACGEKMEGEAMVRKVSSQICGRQAGRQETGSYTLSPPCLTHPTGSMTIICEPLVFPCSSSNRQITAGSHQQRPPYGNCLISLLA